MKRYYKIVEEQEVFFTGNVLYVDGATIVNPTEEQMLEAGWLVWVAPEPTAEELLEIAKANKIADIEMYDQSNEVNLFYLADRPMWLDALTRQTLRISIESYAAMGLEQVTKWFGGNEYTFPTSTWLTMLNALEVYAAEALNVTERHKAAVLAMNNVQDIEDYDITADYPEKLDLNNYGE